MDSEHPRPAKKRQLAAEERQRAVRACGECRRLKEKCEGGVPCKRCRHLRRRCEFNSLPSTHVLHGSINELKERSKYMELILKHDYPDLALDIVSLRRKCASFALSTPQPEQNDTMAETLEASVNTQPSESPGIDDENCTIDYVDGNTVHYSGEFSHWNYSMHLKRNIDELMVKSNAPTLDNVDRVPDFIRVGEADPNSTSIADIICVLPPRPVAEFLTKVFFKHATSFYYYVDPRWLDATLERIYTNMEGLCSKDVSVVCVVLMVLAVGTQYVHLESPKQHDRRSSSISGTFDIQGNWELDIGSAFYRQVAKLVSEIIHTGSLLSVQVFLLLGLYSLPIDASGLGYIYLNLAIKVGIQNGMHRNVSRNDMDATTKEIRHRIWWTVYCMERKIGIYHGRPASIARSDIDADIPRKLDINHTRDDVFSLTGLLEAINLTGQAEAFLQEISRLRTCPRPEVGTILNRIKRMKGTLRGRWSPPCSDVSPTPMNGTSPPKSRADIHSQLECCLLHMFIGRPFILAHRQAQVRAKVSAPSDASRRSANNSHIQWNFLVQDCIAAAKDAIGICYMMQTGSMGLARSSYTEYSSCRASLLVLIAYSICYRTNEFSSTLHKGLDTIREMASVGESARSEVCLLETLEAALHRLHVFDSTSTQPPPLVAKETTQEGYEGLFNWYTKLAGSANPRQAYPPPYNPQETVAQNRDATLQSGPNRDDATINHVSHDMFMDDYPFDFDILNSNANVAFFTPDYNDHRNPERELFENFMWAAT